MPKQTISYHIKIERYLDDQIQEALRVEARRQGVRKITLARFAREALQRAVNDSLSEGGR